MPDQVATLSVTQLNDLERLAHEMLYAIEELQRERKALTYRIERMAIVVKGMKTLLPSTREAIIQAAKI